MAASVISAIERERKKSRKQIMDEHYQNRTPFPGIVEDLGVSDVRVRQLADEAGYQIVRLLKPKGSD